MNQLIPKQEAEKAAKFFDPEKRKPNPSIDDISFSEDVCIIDEDGVNGLAYYDFELCQWTFHTDTLVDYSEVGNPTKWWWYYPLFKIVDGSPVKVVDAKFSEVFPVLEKCRQTLSECKTEIIRHISRDHEIEAKIKSALSDLNELLKTEE